MKQVDQRLDLPKAELEIQRFWRENDVYRKVREMRKGGPRFYHCDGPPYATGDIHLGHAWNKTIKDAILRFKSMQGYEIRDQAGWDVHGLPIEVQVEKHLGISTKREIEEKIGIDKFVEECRKFALRYVERMTEQFRRMGVWMDFDNPYITLSRDFINAAWWTLARAYEKGLLYNDLRCINWCPRCETALADAEIEYKDITDPSIYVKFRLRGRENEYIVIWTTTPWTLVANMAVAVHPEFTYARVRVGEEIWIVAKDLLDQFSREVGLEEYEILEEIRGRDLEGLEYEHPLLDEVPRQRDFQGTAHRVILGEHVTLGSGTGCVHTAPAHGPEDFEVCRRYGIPIFNPVGPDGRYTEDGGKYAGIHVREANKRIIEDLKRKGLLVKSGTISHRYGHCWRCKSPIIYRATKQWFLKVTAVKDKMLEEIDKVEWYPEWAGKSRFKDWVANARDWTISRQRYWGIPIPVWICSRCGGLIVIESLEDLERRAGKLPEDFDPHRPWVDEIVLRCDKCGGEARRIPDVLDVWVDSGVASYACLGFPSRRDEFEKWWPSDWITEGHDQTRGWFYSQLGVSVIAFGKAPYKKVLMHGFVLDEKGQKMSKSLGNVVNPWEVWDKYGADVLRFFVLWATAPWEDLPFKWSSVEQVNRMFNILWNCFYFSTLYMSLDDFSPSKYEESEILENLEVEDRWLLSRINTLTRYVTENVESFNLHLATRAIYDFVVEDLSRWYIRLVRDRVWIETEHPSKIAAYWTLFYVFDKLSRLMAPFTPHLSELIYQNMIRAADEKKPLSVHMQDWPRVDERFLDPEIEEAMDLAKKIVEAIWSLRSKIGIKLRWPLRKARIVPESERERKLLELVRGVISEMANLKEIEIEEPGEELPEIRYSLKPLYGKLGPRFKSRTPIVVRALEKLDPLEAKRELEESGRLSLKLEDGEVVEITIDEVEIERILPEGTYETSVDGNWIVIDATLTDDLKAEAMTRELVRRVQQMRKELNLHVEAMILTKVRADEEFRRYVSMMEDYFKRETRSTELVFVEGDEDVDGDLVRDWEIGDIRVRIGIRQVG